MHTATSPQPQPRDDDERLIGAIETRRDRQLRVTTSTFKGRRYLGVRQWYDASKGPDPEWRPTGKGFNIPLDDAGELAALIQRAAAERR